jgi:hypothetical protein
LTGPRKRIGMGRTQTMHKACNRARVQEGIKNPPPLAGSEQGDVDTPPDDIIEEVRELFASDALEEV